MDGSLRRNTRIHKGNTKGKPNIKWAKNKTKELTNYTSQNMAPVQNYDKQAKILSNLELKGGIEP